MVSFSDQSVGYHSGILAQMNKGMSKRGYLISGASGRVGRHFVDRLQDREDVFVRALGRREPCDILWDKLCVEDFQNIDVVYHFAGTTDLWSLRNDETTHFVVNVELSERIFALFLESDATLFVYMSTAKVMGEGRAEAYRIGEMPQPVTGYAKSKWMAEQRLMKLWLQYKERYPDTKKRWVVLRPTMIYSAGGDGSLFKLQRWIEWGGPVLENWLSTKRSMVSMESVLDVLEEIPSAPLLLPCYFLADLPTMDLGEIISLMSGSGNKRIRTMSLKPWQRRFLLFVDKWLLGGRLSWQLHRMETNFVVEGEGIWGVKGSEELKLSERRLLAFIQSQKR